MLTGEGVESAAIGSPEARVFALVPATGAISITELQGRPGLVAPVFFLCFFYPPFFLLFFFFPSFFSALTLQPTTHTHRYTEPGYKTCMKNKWLQPEKQDGVVVVARKTAAITDSVQVELQALAAGKTLPDDVTANLTKRTLVQKQYCALGGVATSVPC
jgi:hypothetical protein